MPLVQPAQRRSRSNETAAGFEVVIPAKRHAFLIAFLPIWLVGWAWGEIIVIALLLNSDLSTGPSLFLLVWLAGWTLGGGFALFALALHLDVDAIHRANFRTEQARGAARHVVVHKAAVAIRERPALMRELLRDGLLA